MYANQTGHILLFVVVIIIIYYLFIYHVYIFLYISFMQTRLEKTTPISLIAVRQTLASRHPLDPIEGPLKPLGPSQFYVIELFADGRESLGQPL